jgi:hypothetical protein
MLIKRIVDDCDGKGPREVDVEVPDISPDEAATRAAAAAARLGRQKPQQPA